MTMYRVKENRTEIGDKSFLFGYDVIEYGAEQRVLNTHPLTQQGARELAAAHEWAWHLDQWMTTVVEDEDAVEEIGEILGLVAEIDFSSNDDEEISKAYDRMEAGALGLLPAGLRLLADLYEKEWKSKHAAAV